MLANFDKDNFVVNSNLGGHKVASSGKDRDIILNELIKGNCLRSWKLRLRMI